MIKKIYKLAIFLFSGVAWAAIATALELSSGASFIGGVFIGWAVALVLMD